MSGFWSLAFSWGKAFANWYWGGPDGLLSSLAVFVVMAHITGGMCIIHHKPFFTNYYLFDRLPCLCNQMRQLFKCRHKQSSYTLLL